MSYFVSTVPTPLFNRSDFSDLFRGETTNLLRGLEMIALPGTVFSIESEQKNSIIQVQTIDYPSLQPIYLDTRFGKVIKEKPPRLKRKLPSPEVILKRMKANIGLPYIWGGNVSGGVQNLLHFYPSLVKKIQNDFDKACWTFKGLDCSGLLYEATEGATPRNTDALLFYGESVPISLLNWEELPGVLEPLDLIVWNGHVVIVCDSHTVIESKHEWGGVCQTNLVKRLEVLRYEEKKRMGDDSIHALQNKDIFLVRRFIPR